MRQGIINFNRAAFKHGITEADILWAFQAYICDIFQYARRLGNFCNEAMRGMDSAWQDGYTPDAYV